MKNILIVDDDSGIGEMLKMLLEMNAYEVWVTQHPKETETHIKKYQIEMILLDMLISGTNGTDVCERLRENEDPQISGVKILMMSALHDADKKCKAAGANDFIAKPFETSDLLRKIESLKVHP
ncbi:MAG TPA: response regulator [Salinimicrobium sp.]|nr:response regulator [Salinimicrobium sp.]